MLRGARKWLPGYIDQLRPVSDAIKINKMSGWYVTQNRNTLTHTRTIPIKIVKLNKNCSQLCKLILLRNLNELTDQITHKKLCSATF